MVNSKGVLIGNQKFAIRKTIYTTIIIELDRGQEVDKNLFKDTPVLSSYCFLEVKIIRNLDFSSLIGM